MPTVAENLKTLLESEPGMSPTRLARETGVSQPTIWKILNGKIADPGTDLLEPLARRFGKAVAQLRGEIPLDLSASEPIGRYVLVPHYNAVGGLGAGRINEHHIELQGEYPLPEHLVSANGWRPAALMVVDTVGPSMEPTIHDGDPVVVNSDEKKIVSGKIYAIEDPDDGLRNYLLTVSMPFGIVGGRNAQARIARRPGFRPLRGTPRCTTGKVKETGEPEVEARCDLQPPEDGMANQRIDAPLLIDAIRALEKADSLLMENRHTDLAVARARGSHAAQCNDIAFQLKAALGGLYVDITPPADTGLREAPSEHDLSLQANGVAAVAFPTGDMSTFGTALQPGT